MTFHRKRSTFQNVWRQSSGTKCTWTTWQANVLKLVLISYRKQSSIFIRWQVCQMLAFINNISLLFFRKFWKATIMYLNLTWRSLGKKAVLFKYVWRQTSGTKSTSFWHKWNLKIPFLCCLRTSQLRFALLKSVLHKTTTRCLSNIQVNDFRLHILTT